MSKHSSPQLDTKIKQSCSLLSKAQLHYEYNRKINEERSALSADPHNR
ncbi:hypothetical protein [Candidatus Nanosynbacter lyticus]|nr:hypothetical protein [Candidatus Nanosynbacter lyticus]